MLTVGCCLGNFCANVLSLSRLLLFLKCHANYADDAFHGLRTSFKEKYMREWNGDVCTNLCFASHSKEESIFHLCAPFKIEFAFVMKLFLICWFNVMMVHPARDMVHLLLFMGTLPLWIFFRTQFFSFFFLIGPNFFLFVVIMKSMLLGFTTIQVAHLYICTLEWRKISRCKITKKKKILIWGHPPQLVDTSLPPLRFFHFRSP